MKTNDPGVVQKASNSGHESFDIIVVGAGHNGLVAAKSAAFSAAKTRSR
jgi:ribulose 1,5-bisphosphate synthetase/thiazole synthase